MSEMSTPRRLDDATVEALLHGETVPSEWDPLVDALDAIRRVGDEHVTPSAELAESMSRGDFSHVEASTARMPFGRRLGSKLSVMSRPARWATGAAVLLTGFTGVAVAGGVPEGVQARVQDVIESVVPGVGKGHSDADSDRGDTGSVTQDVGRQRGDGGEVFPEKAGATSGQGAGKPEENPGQGAGKPEENPGQGAGKPEENPGKNSGKPAENPGKGPSGSGRPEGTGNASSSKGHGPPADTPARPGKR